MTNSDNSKFWSEKLTLEFDSGEIKIFSQSLTSKKSHLLTSTQTSDTVSPCQQSQAQNSITDTEHYSKSLQPNQDFYFEIICYCYYM